MAVEFPFGDANLVTITDAATSTITVEDSFTIAQQLSGFAQAVTALSINQKPEGVKIGAKIKLDILQDATGRNVTFGSAGDTITAPVLTGVANDRDTIVLTWDGTLWLAESDWFKVVNAV